MNTILIKRSLKPIRFGLALKILGVLLLLWTLAPLAIQHFSPTSGSIDNGIWQLILLAFICWLIILILAGFMAKSLYHKLTLLLRQDIHSPLTLTSWQHIVLYWASFALLALSATGCLIAIV